MYKDCTYFQGKQSFEVHILPSLKIQALELFQVESLALEILAKKVKHSKNKKIYERNLENFWSAIFTPLVPTAKHSH